jgi:hypothetical protein
VQKVVTVHFGMGHREFRERTLAIDCAFMLGSWRLERVLGIPLVSK